MPFDHIELVLKLKLGETRLGVDGAPSRAELRVQASLNRAPYIEEDSELVPWSELRKRPHAERDMAKRLFPSRVRKLLDKGMAYCAEHSSWLRVVIEFPPYPERNREAWTWMIEMPWERVHLTPEGEETGQPVALWPDESQVSIVRTMAQSHDVSRGLRAGAGSTYLHVDATIGDLKATAARLDETKVGVVPTPADFTKKKLAKLLENSHDVLHLTGHGRPGKIPVPGNGLVNPDEFAEMVKSADVRLLLTSVCHSGLGEGKDTEGGGLVAHLERLGLPVFIGMQESISTDANAVFVNALFASLSSGESVDEAVWRGRKSLFERMGDGPHAWSVPVLYASPIARSDPFLWDPPQSKFAVARDAEVRWATAVRTMTDESNQVHVLDRGAQGNVFSISDGSAGSHSDAVQVAPDATVAAAIHRGRLYVSWISQSGGLRPWPALDVTTFTDDPESTRLLAVAKKGAKSVHCLLSDGATTYLIRVWPSAVGRVRVERVRRVSDKPASAGVLWAEKALLISAEANGRRTNDAFPELADIWFVDGACGRDSLCVAALGLDADSVLAVHVNGRDGLSDVLGHDAVGLVRTALSSRGASDVASLAVFDNGVTTLHDVALMDRWAADESWL